jgi:hypothetical protein
MGLVTIRRLARSGVDGSLNDVTGFRVWPLAVLT